MLYQRIYTTKNIQKYYLSPYIEYQIKDTKLYFYNFYQEIEIRLSSLAADELIQKLNNGITQEEFIEWVTEHHHGDDLGEKLFTLFIQNNILE